MIKGFNLNPLSLSLAYLSSSVHETALFRVDRIATVHAATEREKAAHADAEAERQEGEEHDQKRLLRWIAPDRIQPQHRAVFVFHHLRLVRGRNGDRIADQDGQSGADHQEADEKQKHGGEEAGSEISVHFDFKILERFLVLVSWVVKCQESQQMRKSRCTGLHSYVFAVNGWDLKESSPWV